MTKPSAEVVAVSNALSRMHLKYIHATRERDLYHRMCEIMQDRLNLTDDELDEIRASVKKEQEE